MEVAHSAIVLVPRQGCHGWMDEGKVGRARGGQIDTLDDLFIDLGYRFHSGISISKFVVRF